MAFRYQYTYSIPHEICTTRILVEEEVIRFYAMCYMLKLSSHFYIYLTTDLMHIIKALKLKLKLYHRQIKVRVKDALKIILVYNATCNVLLCV